MKMAAKDKKLMLERREVVSRLLADREDALVVTGLGAPTWDATAAGDHPLNFYLWGGMGGAAMVGLGLALARPERRVLVLTGDGEMLMGLGSLATIAVQRPANLAVVVLDNEHYGETGMQEAHTRHGVDLALIAKGAGIAAAACLREQRELESWVPRLYTDRGPLFVAIKVSTRHARMVLPISDGTAIQHRFRAALANAGRARSKR
jgi:thiamine pyrophosphate-dependent acetolactate synthase large subunit-like protein